MAKENKTESKQEIQKVQPAHVISPINEMERMFDRYFSRG